MHDEIELHELNTPKGYWHRLIEPKMKFMSRQLFPCSFKGSYHNKLYDFIEKFHSLGSVLVHYPEHYKLDKNFNPKSLDKEGLRREITGLPEMLEWIERGKHSSGAKTHGETIRQFGEVFVLGKFPKHESFSETDAFSSFTVDTCDQDFTIEGFHLWESDGLEIFKTLNTIHSELQHKFGKFL